MSDMDLATRWDNPSFMQGTIMSDNRDFERPVQQTMGIQLPDSLSAEDKSPIVEVIQKFMKSSPLGASYSGPVDGIMNPALLQSVLIFQNKAKTKTGQDISLISGNQIDANGFKKVLELLKSPKEEGKEEKPAGSDDPLNNQFEQYLSQSHPIIGTAYQGDLGAAAKKVEGALAAALGNNGIYGKLWNSSSQKFNTTPQDLDQAIQLIVKSKGKTASRIEKLEIIQEKMTK